MSLINEQQEKNSQVSEPEIKPISVAQAPVDIPVPPPQAPADGGIPMSEQPEPAQDFAAPNAKPVLPETKPGDLPYFSPTPTPEIPAPPAQITPLPSILSDVTQEFGKGSQWNPTIVNNKLPTVYISEPSNAGYNQALQNLGATVTGYNKQAADAYAEAERTAERLRTSTPNVPQTEKNWVQGGIEFLRDVVTGSEKARAAADRGEWTNFFNPDPRQTTYGRAGAGLLGAANYVFGTLGNIGVGAVAEANKNTAASLERFGVPTDKARAFAERGVLGLIPGDPLKKLNVIGFNWEEAIKRNSVVDAILGDQVSSIQGNIDTTKAGVGRVFYNPRLKPGESGWKDPLGVAIQIGTYIFNPGEIATDELVSRGIGKLFGVGSKKATTAATATSAATEAAKSPQLALPPGKSTPPPANLGLDLSKLTEEQLRQQRVGTPRLTGSETTELPLLSGKGEVVQVVDAEIVSPEFTYNPTKPAAANPTKVTRVEIGSTNVNRKLLPPAIEPELIPNKAPLVLPPSSPAHTALEVGIGKSSTIRITDPGQLVIRSYPDMVQQIETKAPKLLEGYKGVTWEDLKRHLSTKGVDVSQFNAVGADIRALPPAKAEVVTPELDVVKPGEPSVNLEVPAPQATEVKTYADVLSRIGANTSEPTDLNEIASIVQELAIEQGAKAKEVNLDELLPKAVEQFNQGKRINLSEITIAKQYSQKEFDDVGFDVNILKRNVEKRGIKLTGDEDPRVLDIVLQELQKSDASVEKIQKLLDSGKIRIYDDVNDIPRVDGNDLLSKFKTSVAPTPKPLTNDDLLTAAEELAAQKLIIEANLNQLDNLFNDSVDFGRRASNDLGLRPTTTDEILSVITNGGKPNLHPSIADLPGGKALLKADLNELIVEGARQGLNPRQLVEAAVNHSNRVLGTPTPVNRALTKAPVATTKLPRDLYHGTALADWKPAYNLSENGSRGELGYGLYLTKDPLVGKDYARARMGDNVNPSTLDKDLAPAVYKISGQLTTTLDARAKVPTSSDFFKQLSEGLPDELKKAVSRSLNRSKDNTYSGFLNKLESSMVKAGIDPSEANLQQMQKIVSDNLRRMGYDSVYDGKSGFALALDESALKVTNKVDIPPAMDATEAALARYNADAYAAKFYGDRLTTDANLRDSTARLLNQLRENVDNKLAEVQEQLMMRPLSDTSSILPKIADDGTQQAPKSVSELMQTMDNIIDDICGL